MQKKVTLSFDDKIYKEFQVFCEANDVILSKRLQRLMEEHIRQGKKEVKK